MTEETNHKNKPLLENQPEPDPRLPYKPPVLRKHGKVNHATQSTFIIGDFDNLFGPGFADLG